jgi:hypothetical protein
MVMEILDASGAHKVHVLIANYKRYVCVCVWFWWLIFLGVATMLLFMVAAE